MARLTWPGDITAASKISAKHMVNFRSASIAARMTWASERETTEKYDTAYRLLGVFSQSLDLRDGEGKGAFLRLEGSIIRIHQRALTQDIHIPQTEVEKPHLSRTAFKLPKTWQ